MIKNFKKKYKKNFGDQKHFKQNIRAEKNFKKKNWRPEKKIQEKKLESTKNFKKFFLRH